MLKEEPVETLSHLLTEEELDLVLVGYGVVRRNYGQRDARGFLFLSIFRLLIRLEYRECIFRDMMRLLYWCRKYNFCRLERAILSFMYLESSSELQKN